MYPNLYYPTGNCEVKDKSTIFFFNTFGWQEKHSHWRICRRGETVKRRRVCIISRDPLLKLYLEQRLSECETLELVNSTVVADATVTELKLLTANEVQLLQTVADCGSVEKASRVLVRSVATLKRELATIRDKLGVRTTMQAVVWALRNGIIR